MGLSKMHLWFAMSLDAVGGANQHHMLRHILIQDMGTGIDLRQNGNRRASALPASEKRVIAESIGCATRVGFWPELANRRAFAPLTGITRTFKRSIRYWNLGNVPSGAQSIFSPSAVTTGVQRAMSSASIRRNFSGLESGVGSSPASINIRW